MYLTVTEHEAIEARLDAMLLDPLERLNISNEAGSGDVLDLIDRIALIAERGASNADETALVDIVKGIARKMEVRVATEAKAKIEAMREAA